MYQTKPRIWVRVLLGLLALALLAGSLFIFFRLTDGIFIPGEREGAVEGMRYYFTPHMPHRFYFSPVGGFFFGFLFLMLFFAVLRRAIWGPRWGWGMRGHHGMHGYGRLEEMHAELHKRMDAKQNEAEGNGPEDQPIEEA